LSFNSYYSQNGTPGATITKVEFSPSENLIAWTDTDGVFTRWPKPISDNYPDPVKVNRATAAPATIPVKPPKDLDLFGLDDLQDSALDLLNDNDSDADMPPDDWIIDDTDGALNAPDIDSSTKNGLVKEMGERAFVE
jgi:chromosome transmission fidelity protein 4